MGASGGGAVGASVGGSSTSSGGALAVAERAAGSGAFVQVAAVAADAKTAATPVGHAEANHSAPVSGTANVGDT